MGYTNRISRDTTRWMEAGWLNVTQRDNILSDVRKNNASWSPIGALAIMGAILLAMAALSFVASNWTAMPKIMKLVVIMSSLWAALLSSGRALDKNQPMLGHALALLGAALFGIAIMLTAQTFNMSSFKNTAVLIWASSALLIAFILPSRPVLILSTLLGAVWVIMETQNPFMPTIMWSYLILWGITAFIANRQKSVIAFNLLAIALFIWLGHVLWTYYDRQLLSPLEWIVSFVMATGMIAGFTAQFRDWGIFGTGTLSNWSLTLALIAGFSLQWALASHFTWEMRHENFGETSIYPIIATITLVIIASISIIRMLQSQITQSTLLGYMAAAGIAAALPFLVSMVDANALTPLRILFGTAFYALTIALVIQGSKSGRRFIGGVGIAAFIVQTLYVYSETFGDLLDTSLFFLIGGLILFGVSMTMLKVRSSLSKGASS